MAVIPHEFEQWVADDGTAIVRKRIIHEDQATFPTPEDKAALRGASQRPAVLDDESPRAQRDAEVARHRASPRCGRCPPTRRRCAPRSRTRNVSLTARAGQLLSFAAHAARRQGRAVRGAQEPAGRDARSRRHRPARADRRRRASSTIDAWRTLFLFDPETGALLGTRSIGHKELPGRDIDDWNLDRGVKPDGHRARRRAR